MTKTAQIKKLKNIIQNEKGTLRAYVAQEILDNSNGIGTSIDAWLDDLSCHGCASGMVGSLVYYSDTVEFFNHFEDEIEDLILETADSCGQTYAEFMSCMMEQHNIESLYSLKNYLTWFAFEETAFKIAAEELKIAA